ncbi:MAG: DEAD/DEAH box helicase [Paludibacter sp.]|nr:DEAD/DEAH box helicase [Paludibacter sp.]
MLQLIVCIRKHVLFGYILMPYMAEYNKTTAHFTLFEQFTPKRDYFKKSPKEIQQLVKASAELSDQNIAHQFFKNTGNLKSAWDDANELKQNFVREYVDKRIDLILNVMQEGKLPLFFKDEKYANVYTDDRIELLPQKSRAVFHFHRMEEETRYFLSVRYNGKSIRLFEKAAYVLHQSPCRIIIDNRLYSFPDIDAKKLLPFILKEYVSVPKAMEEKYFKTFVLNAIRDFDVEAEGFTIETYRGNPALVLLLEKDLQGNYAFMLQFDYPDKSWKYFEERKVSVKFQNQDDEYFFRKTFRNELFEKKALERIKELGLEFCNDQFVRVSGRNPDQHAMQLEVIEWLKNNRQKLEDAGIGFRQHLDKIFSLETPELKEEFSAKRDWFDLNIWVHVGSQKIPFPSLKEYILSKQREVVLPNGEIAILPEEWLARFEGVFLMAEGKHDKMRLSVQHANLLRADEEPEEVSTEKQPTLGWQEAPAGLNASLRHYQMIGYNWMLALLQQNRGFCLADDMGLGKTIQVIAVLLHQLRTIDNQKNSDIQPSLFEEPARKTYQPNLIVVPTSLIFNWQQEIRKFAPSLTVWVHHGPARDRSLERAAKRAVILTSYSLVRNDIDLFKNIHFQNIILDESQYVKNPASKTYQALMQLSADHKLLLTGTPIENSLADLWAQMNFANKGFLHSFSYFNSNFIDPIEKDKNPRREELLKKMIAPFILRRTKEEVAPELPKLSVQVVYCEMEEEQAKLYEEEKSKVRNEILETREQASRLKMSNYVQQALTRLRQIANHPALCGYNDYPSGKYDSIIEALENVRNRKHKVLIFSSFVMHLNLFKSYFEENNLDYCLLTGETTNRQEVVERFQNNRDISFFLISIKAGGVGLNLTAADYVFIVDPWWNPAVEMQAVSRAHRIGQQQNVFVYHFITRGTIEEKIRLLQEEKTGLAKTFVNSENNIQPADLDAYLELVME